MRLIRPTHVSKFQCDGSACNSNCCREWEITIDEETFEKYSKLDSEIRDKILENLKVMHGQHYVKLREDMRCPFLDTDNLCKLQKQFGEGFISDLCACYPRIAYRIRGENDEGKIEEVVEQSLVVTCPLAAREIFFGGQVEFEEQVFDDDLLTTSKKFRLIFDWSKNVELAFKSRWLKVQMQAIGILQASDFPFDRRLYLLLDFFSQLDKYRDAFVDELKTLDSQLNEGFSFDGEVLSGSTRFKINTHIEFMTEIFNELYNFPDDDLHRNAMKATFIDAQRNFLPGLIERYSQPLENFLVNEFFMRLYPFTFKIPKRPDEQFLINGEVLVVVFKCVMFVMAMTYISRRGNFTDEDFLLMANRTIERIDHNRNGINMICEKVTNRFHSLEDFASTMFNL
ncbi:MAG: flagellin lysine-N-methylase [Selenomonadaceae bacterium]|nr:flagellin lysine-N-methylase [Selenomonadaceae bacterium]